MKKKLLSISVIVMFGFFMLTSCGSDETTDTDNNTTDDVENVEDEKSDDVSSNSATPYSIESGIMEYTTDVLGVEVVTTIYFDDYGNREESVMFCDDAIMGMNERTFTKDGYEFTIDLKENTATKVKLPEDMQVMNEAGVLNPAQMTDDQKRMYDLKEEGSEKVLGKTCNVFSTIGLAGKRTKFYEYKGVMMKIEMGGELVYEAYKFEENATMPEWFYEIPDGIEVEEVEMPSFY